MAKCKLTLFAIWTIAAHNLFAQNVGIGNINPQSALDIEGDLSLRSVTDTIMVGVDYAYDVNTIKSSNYKLVGFNANFVLAGITPGVEGRIITLRNATSFSMELYNEELAADEEKRISTGINNTLAVYPGGSVKLIYDSAIQRWVVISAHNYNLNYYGTNDGWSLNGNSGTTADNFIGTNDEQPLRFKINAGSAGIIDSVYGNTSLGVAALRNTLTGFNNTVIGKDAMKASTNNYAQNNVAIGAGSMENTIYAEGHVAIGYQSLQNFDNNNFPAGTFGANHNTAVGYKTLRSNEPTGVSNTAIGGNALSDNTAGYNNTAVGDYAMWKNTTGYNNVSLGANALSSNTVGKENVALGSNSGRLNTGSYSTSVGFQSLEQNLWNFNTAVGHQALQNSGSENNTAVGAGAIKAGSYRSTALGSFAMFNGGGFDNVAVGMHALLNNNGYGNTSCGTFSLTLPVTGNQNTALGYFAMPNGTSGSNNIGIGYNSLKYNNGNFNIGIGYEPHLMNITGSWNTVIGEHANTSVNNLDGVTAIGASAIASASNKIFLGANVAGMEVRAFGPYTNLSDGRFKEHIQENIPGLNFITRLRPVSYTFNVEKLHKHITSHMPDSLAIHYYPDLLLKEKADLEIRTGFIAQEVEVLAASLHFKFDGIKHPQNVTDTYSISYSQFVVPLVKAVQEQQSEIEILKQEMQDLRSDVQSLLAALKGHNIKSGSNK